MATVLFITAHPQDNGSSYSMAVGKEFINCYKETNPSDEIVHLDLFKMDIPYIDSDVLNAREKLMVGKPFEELTVSEQAKLARMEELATQFSKADKYVFVSPLWNLSYPPVVKAYIDAICLEGKAVQHTETGVIGLLTNKKAVHVQASGGFYSEGPFASFESGHSTLRNFMQYVGVASFQGIFIEGVLAVPHQAEAIKEAAIIKAQEMAKLF
ncbi:NAD(P)H-dependent oxidoreductase [Cohnella boryungensis]|uniref:FMN dependent NADH:quinone oxidoreductase n=1 Tax=Cohnella boryungensis TaxID=768479 RepID=A0ABV8SAC5_9BACL